jgi:hypothetical protein
MAIPVNDPDHGFCRDCLTDTGGALRCPRCGSPRTLVHGELYALTLAHIDCDAFYATIEKRDNPDACRQAADHRRRQARRRLDRLLYRPHQRRALGDADVQGAGTLPRRRRDPAEHGEICDGRAAGARHDARSDAAGSAAVDRRGLSRTRRHRTAAPRPAGANSRQVRPRVEGRDRHQRFGRPLLLQVPRQGRLRSQTSRAVFR